MRRWALLVVVLYGLILVALTLPLLIAGFWPKEHVADLAAAFSSPGYWLVVGVLVLSQATLLKVPVRVASRRPVARRSIIPLLLVSGFMAAGLALGAFVSLSEFITRDTSWSDQGRIQLTIAGLTWALWTAVFYRLSRKESAGDAVSRQCRLLLKGSILELLVAVPTHIVARGRDYCCAGFATFFGIALGISVMLFSFGPAVFFLFADRWKRLHPQG